MRQSQSHHTKSNARRSPGPLAEFSLGPDSSWKVGEMVREDGIAKLSELSTKHLRVLDVFVASYNGSSYPQGLMAREIRDAFNLRHGSNMTSQQVVNYFAKVFEPLELVERFTDRNLPVMWKPRPPLWALSINGLLGDKRITNEGSGEKAAKSK